MASASGDLSPPLAHVAFVAFPFGTHAAPLLALARALAAAAPAATFSFLSTPRSLSSLSPPSDLPNFRFVGISDGISAADCSPSPNYLMAAIGSFMAAAEGSLIKKGIEAAEGEAGGVKVSCIVSDAFLWMVRDVAAEMAARWVALWTGGPPSLLAHVHTDLIREKIGVGEEATAVKANKKIDFIPGLSAVRVRDLPEGVVFGDLDSAISVAVYRMGQQLHRAAAVVLNTFTGLEPSSVESDFSSIFNKFLPVGPLHLLSPRPSEPDDSNCLVWLDGHVAKSVAYIAFGSLLTPPPFELAALAEGLEESGVPFLWSLKESGRENLPRGFLDRTAGRGLVVAWTPQVEVLGHPAVGAFVTHAGWNSVMESVTAGVPLACRPFFGDQRLIARTVESVWRNGVSFDGEAMTRDTAVRALNKILKSEEGNKMKKKAEELKMMAAAAAADDGSSVESFKSLLEMVLMPKD